MKMRFQKIAKTIAVQLGILVSKTLQRMLVKTSSRVSRSYVYRKGLQ